MISTTKEATDKLLTYDYPAAMTQSAPPGKTSDSFYDLGPEQVLQAIESIGFACDGYQLALNSYENRVYQIGIEDGEAMVDAIDDATAVVAKFYRPGRWSDDAILEEHAFTEELAELEIPVIAPLTIDGATLHRFAGHRFALYPLRAGRAPDLENKAHLEQLGRFVARIHALGETADFEHRPRLDVHTFGDDAFEFLLDHNFIPPALATPYEKLAHDLLDVVELSFDAVDPVFIRLHGDGHPGNILWHNDAPHIVDFDDARMGPAVQDLWMFLSGEREHQATMLDTLLTAYTQFHDFDCRELSLIEPLRTLRLMHHAAWIAERWEDPAFRAAFPWFNTERYWQEHILTLKEQVSAMQEHPLQWL